MTVAHGERWVTFLFTDIEASTPQWEAHEAAMAQAMARHDAIVSECVEAAGGINHRSRGEGDSKFLVFDDPASAVSAAVDIARRLESEPWPEGTFIRIRAGIHSGPCRLAAGDYFGPEVNRAARLRSAAHGGQCLISEAAVSAIDRPPDGIGFLDLGRHRLKDLLGPIHVWQVLHPDLPADFPPIQSLRLTSTNLPTQANAFVGRMAEFAELRSLLSAHRLVTLHGLGGVGKTRLAVQFGAEEAAGFAGGLWFIDLTRCRHSDEIWIEAGRALGVRDVPARPLEMAVRERLTSANSLLLLDNCEHLLPDLAGVVGDLVAMTTDLRILATSREPIGVPGERLVTLKPLSTQAESGAAGLESDAARLFIDRALALKSDFDFGPWNAPAIQTLCEGLDGLPLAIELVAEGVISFGMADLLALLPNRLRSFEGAGRDPRHRTLEANIAWSFERLDDRERDVALSMSIAEPGFDLEAIQFISSIDPSDSCAPAVNRLVRKAILVPDFDGSATRYRFLPTVRAYASGVSSEEDRDRARFRHRTHYAELAEKMCNELEGPQATSAAEWLDANEANVLSAMRADAEDPNTYGRAQRVAALMFRLWDNKGRHTLAKQTYRELLAKLPRDENSMERGLVHNSLGVTHLRVGEYELAEAELERAVSLREQNGDISGAARSRFNLGSIAMIRGRYDQARTAFEVALEVLEGHVGPVARATIRMNLGLLDLELGEPKRALEQSRRALSDLGDVVGTGLRPCIVGNIAIALTQLGHYPEALAQFDALAKELERDPNEREIARLQTNHAETLRRAGQTLKAAELMTGALERHAASSDRRGQATALDVASGILADLGDDRSAWMALHHADGIRSEIGARLQVGEAERVGQLRERLSAQAGARDAEPRSDEAAIRKAREALTRASKGTARNRLL